MNGALFFSSRFSFFYGFPPSVPHHHPLGFTAFTLPICIPHGFFFFHLGINFDMVFHPIWDRSVPHHHPLGFMALTLQIRIPHVFCYFFQSGYFFFMVSSPLRDRSVQHHNSFGCSFFEIEYEPLQWWVGTDFSWWGGVTDLFHMGVL